MKWCFIFLYLFSCAWADEKEEAWIVKEEFLSVDREDFDCHSSSIVETLPGHLCAVWKGGPGKGESNHSISENVGIWASLYDGKGWSIPEEIVSVPHSVTWTPILCKLSSEELLLFYRTGPDPRRQVSFVKRSHDFGESWSEEEILPAGIAGPKGKPLLLSDGSLLCPSSIEVGEPEDLFKATACWIEISEDNGMHWKKVGPLELPHRKFGGIEPVLFIDSDGHLRMLCRDRAHRIGEVGYIWEAISVDGGLHWSDFERTSLPNPDSGIDAVDLGGGKIVLFYNHSHTDRFPLHCAISCDGGNHWSAPIVLDSAGEFPAATATSDGLIHLTYSTKWPQREQRGIKHLVINAELLQSVPESNG
ncbi:MAG: sialidase family protein [Chlamydiota bacterium]